jgi:outer membrane protein TolC
MRFWYDRARWKRFAEVDALASEEDHLTSMWNPRTAVGAVTRFAICALLIGLIAACSAEKYRESADREVKAIVVEKRKQVTGKEEPFDLKRETIPIDRIGRPGDVEDLKNTPEPVPIVEPLALEEKKANEASSAPPAVPPRAESPPAGAPPTEAPATPPGAVPPALGVESAAPPAAAPPAPPAGAVPPVEKAEQAEKPAMVLPEEQPAKAPRIPARILNLADVLKVAFANNRDYQSQKESVYLNGLALTLARWQFAPRFFGIITGDYERNSNGDESGGISTSFGFNKLFATGARLGVSIANNFLIFFTRERREVANTLINGTLTQPLLRGFGSHIVREPVIQAERNVIYGVRAYERYRQTFALRIASDFYQVLEARNRVTNEYMNWQSLVNDLERSNSLAEGERIPKYQVDQVLQQVLSAKNRYVVTVESYAAALDRLKVTLLFPVDTTIGLDRAELALLESNMAAPIDVDLDAAIATALRRRLDYLTERDQVEDAERKVIVAADALRAQLDLRATGGLGSGTGGDQQPLKFDASTGTAGVGLDLNLPFDRKAERNAYVQALIAVDVQKRAASLSEDNIRIAVRDAYRSLLREYETYKIQKASVKLAGDRVESTSALRDAGRADTRDVLESQQALIEARNGLTSALINLAIARLEFASEMGVLRVYEDGRIEEDPIEKPSPPPDGANATRNGPISRSESAGNETKNG